MKYRYIGSDRSAGYEHGREYRLQTWIDDRFIWTATPSTEPVPYASVGAFLRNWEPVRVNTLAPPPESVSEPISTLNATLKVEPDMWDNF